MLDGVPRRRHPKPRAGADQLLPGEGLTDVVPVAHGSTATVHRAYQAHLDRVVAVKVINAPLRDERARQRFLRECRAAGRLGEHPNVVKVFSTGFTTDGRPCIVMEFCAGGSLERPLASGPFPVADVLRIGVKLCSALELAHTTDLLHRDLKPANVLLTGLGEPALADFGIATAVEVTGGSLHAALTPVHAAPEVLQRGGGSVRSDVWSLGSTLWTLLLGRPPFSSSAPGEDALLRVLLRVVEQPPPPLDPHRVPDIVSVAIGSALAKDPAARCPSAVEFARRLQQAQQALGLPVTEFLSRQAFPGVSPAAEEDPTTQRRADLRRGHVVATPSEAVALVPVAPGGAAQEGATRIGETPVLPGIPVSQPGPRGRRLVVAGTAAVMLLAAVGAVILLGRASSPGGTVLPGPTPLPGATVSGMPPGAPATPGTEGAASPAVPPPARPEPAAVMVRDQGTSVLLSWTDTVPPGSLPVVVSKGDGTGALPVTTSPALVEGLDPARGYCFAVGYVINVNGDVSYALPRCVRGARAGTAPPG